jgi:hypothetical protein
MTQTEFWRALERRLTHEFSGMTYRPYRFLWCDGFDPELYELERQPPCIRGKTWIEDGPGENLWDFRLILNRSYASTDEIDWMSLLPGYDLTGWAAIDPHRRYIEMEPGVASPDGEESKHPRMDERGFWTVLMFRVCHEFSGMAERKFRRLWCDGFLPEVYELDLEPPCIRGTAWIGESPKQGPWTFRLILNRRYRSVDEIEWPSLLPKYNFTRWISVDCHHNHIEIEPSVAVPDLEVPRPLS